MFDLIPNLLSYVSCFVAIYAPLRVLCPCIMRALTKFRDRSTISVLLPAFLSYKALLTWLMYWTTLSLLTLAESYIYFLLVWVPLYSTGRLLFVLYLVLPQTQGARHIYETYIHPFLASHEARIDLIITETHEKLRAAGLYYINDFIAWVRRTIFGNDMLHESHSTAGTSNAFVPSLLAKFSLPYLSAIPVPPPSNDIYTLLNSAVGRGSTPLSPRNVTTESTFLGGPVIPPHMEDITERAAFIKQQQDRLQVLLRTLDREAAVIKIEKDVDQRARQGSEGMSKSKSEAGFERIDKDEAKNNDRNWILGGSGWLSWWTRNEDSTAKQHLLEKGSDEAGAHMAQSSGIEL